MALTLVSVKWEQKAQAGRPPLPRQGHAVATLEDMVYVFGGCRYVTEPNKGVFYYRDMFRLHVGENLKWEKVNQSGDIPTGRQDHALCAIGCNLYLFGGKNDLKAHRALQGVYSFDTRENHWSLCQTNGSQPLALNPGVATVYQDIYVIGGVENRVASNEVDVLDTEDLTWTKLSVSGTLPSPRCNHKCVALGRVVYLFGGSGEDDKWHKDTYILDTYAKEWSCPKVKGIMPEARGCFTLTAHSTKDIYVFGGVNDDKLRSALGDFHKLSLGKMKWKQPFFSGPIPTKRFGHSTFIHKNSLFVFGGASEDTFFNDLTIGRLINPSKRKPLKVSSADLHGYLIGMPTSTPTTSNVDKQDTTPESRPARMEKPESKQRSVSDMSDAKSASDSDSQSDSGSGTDSDSDTSG